MPVSPPRARLPTLNALRAFEAAARCGSFAKAAEELGVTPGAVTQQIRQLEAWLGFPLFARQPQGVLLTEAARETLPRLTRGFDMLSQAVENLQAAHRGRALTVAALPCIAQLWLSPRLASLQDAFPGLQISVSAMEQPPDPRREPHDISLFYKPIDELADRSSDGDSIQPVCTPELAAKLTASGDLATQTLLHDAVWRDDWRRWLKEARASGVDPGRGPSFSLYSLALEACLAGRGVFMGRMSLVATHLFNGRLVAPFPLALPTGDKLAIGVALVGQSHPGTEDVADWLRNQA